VYGYSCTAILRPRDNAIDETPNGKLRHFAGCKSLKNGVLSKSIFVDGIIS
jgi:hypothetical protein